MKQKTIDGMRPVVEAFALYEGSKKAFCEERGIAIPTLDYWRRKMKDKADKIKTKAFIALQVEKKSSEQVIELHLPNGVRALVPLQTFPEVLQTLLNFSN